ncbi:MAG: MinD/ParA family protein [Thermostichus sp. BF3_bins_97]
MAKIVSIHSYRGGTGKSNTTANLSAQIAKQGKRVAVIDTDIQSPGVHVLFGLEEEKTGHTLNDYLWGKCRIEEAAHDLTPKAAKAGGGTLYLIPSSVKASDIARILREGYDVGMLNDGFQSLLKKLKLDYLFIDTHPGLNEETLLSITISDVLVLILRPDRQDFQGTAVTVDVARRLEVPNMLLVVNKVLTSFDFAKVKQQVESTYNLTVAGVLPLSEDMVRLGSAGIFSLEFPDHVWSKTIQQIAGYITR